MAKNKQRKSSKKGEELRKVSSSKGGSVKKSEAKVISYIHVGDGGKEDLEKYMSGTSNLTLQVYQEEKLPDIDEVCMINGLDQLGTSADFSDEHHRCSRACPVGCQGHLRPNEIAIYEGLSVKGHLVERKRYRARFILKGPSIVKQKRVKTEPVSSVLSDECIGEEIPEKYKNIIDSSHRFLHNNQLQKEHGWNPDDKSDNLAMKSEEHRCIRRQPVTQSTDGVRAKVGISRGISVYEISWPVKMRGTHASVGVATKHASLQAHGYLPLIGSNNMSWGWDIGRKEIIHQETVSNYPSAVQNHYQWSVPESFYLIIDMEEGVLSFAGDDRWYGAAFTDLQGETVYPAVSTVWGHAEVSIRLLGYNRL